MKEFDQLLELADILLGPNGCPWDREQTFLTLQPYILEEAHEVLEAIDTQDPNKISEETGDLFYALIFLGKIGEKLGVFTLAQILSEVKDKLVRRHPHVFSNEKIETIEELKTLWESVKKTEKAQKDRKSALDGIPPKLPLLARAQKMIRKMKVKENFSTPSEDASIEEKMGNKLLSVIFEIEKHNLDAESLFRRCLNEHEEKFRLSEKNYRR